MASGITLWGRRGDPASADAQRFLKANGYAADRVLDIDTTPPTPEELGRIERGGVALTQLVHPQQAGGAPAESLLAAWLIAGPGRLKAPLLLTPRGALAGFGERKWAQFLDIGRSRS